MKLALKDPVDQWLPLALVATFLPPIVLGLSVFDGLTAGVIAFGWIGVSVLVTALLFVGFRKPAGGDPAALIAARELKFRFQNDRVLAGRIDGVSLKAIGTPSGTRIDAHFDGKVRMTAQEWATSLSDDRVLEMLFAVGDEKVEVEEGVLRSRTPLGFGKPEDGDALALRIREVARIAKALSFAGAPPDGAVEALREAKKRLAQHASGTLSIMETGDAGSVSIAAGEGNVSVAPGTARKQPT